MRKYIHIYIYIYVHMYIHAYMHAYTRIHTYTRAHTHTHMHTHTHTHRYIRTCMHTYVRMQNTCTVRTDVDQQTHVALYVQIYRNKLQHERTHTHNHTLLSTYLYVCRPFCTSCSQVVRSGDGTDDTRGKLTQRSGDDACQWRAHQNHSEPLTAASKQLRRINSSAWCSLADRLAIAPCRDVQSVHIEVHDMEQGVQALLVVTGIA